MRTELKPLGTGEREREREICDRMNREVEISTAQMERIVRDAILSEDVGK